ncbi:MAG TPA: UDP-N-acetylmuramate--L-alanine ligase [Mycobacteriales bacterium]|nr:UDP-N-acetylmuramate--L-alanine ligase [Mycobacteriales bacterium]
MSRSTADADLSKVHLIGVGGAGMSGIARVLLARGASVSGCDARDSRVLEALRQIGADVHVGHDRAHVVRAGRDATVVVSSAIRADNDELVAAREQGNVVLKRGAALAALMAGNRGIAVAGTHGKTTTTSMLTVALQQAGLDPSFAIGGDLNEPGSNAHQGSGDVFVAEADESDGSFLLLAPEIAVVTNVEADHLDHYGDAAAVDAAFDAFIDRIRPGGTLVACADDPGARRVADVARAHGVDVRTYGEAADADVRIVELVLTETGGSVTTLADATGEIGRQVLSVPGRHNALNATAALAVVQRLGVPLPQVAEGLQAFAGARRRMETKGSARGVRVVDSYAHHPTEVMADLRAARQLAGDGRVVAAFQPHLYSRTAFFAADFGRALSAADIVVVMDVYGAREDPVPGVTGALIADAVPAGTEVHYEPSWVSVPPLLASLAQRGDLVITLGAGDITQLGPVVLDELTTR